MDDDLKIVVVSVLLGLVIGLMILAQPLASYRSERGKYKNLLIEHKHARWVIDPLTGATEFQIDSAPKQ